MVPAGPWPSVVFATPGSQETVVTTTSDEVDGDVTSIADLNASPGADGEISLREAISAANATAAGPELTIGFAIPEADAGYDSARGIWLIRPASALPPLSRGGTLLDGSTQAAGHPLIVLDGIDAIDPQGLGNGIRITSAGNTVRALGLVNFYDSGVLLAGPEAELNTVVGCTIGISAVADEAEPNYVGVEIQGGAHDNTIGGSTPAARNIISGNDYGVLVWGATTTRNRVIGNWIGTGHDGQAPVGNIWRGVQVNGGAPENHIGESGVGNVIAASQIGVEIGGGSDRNHIESNIVGLAADGVTPRADPEDESTTLGNSDGGIFILGGSSDNVVGGTDPATRNVIANNGAISSAYGHGIYLNEIGTTGNIIQGNYIGVDRTGIVGRGNLRYGVSIVEGANRTLLGGDAPAAGNVIAFNGFGGIRLSSNTNTVTGNLIGVGADGTTQLGNQRSGVLVTGAANVVGPNNLIAYNQLSGIIISATGTNSAVQGNELHDNDISGVCVQGSDTSVVGNRIHGNGRYRSTTETCAILGGVVVDNASRTRIDSNVIRDNHNVGVRISGGQGNSILTNSITGNALVGIQLQNGGNQGLAAPEITGVSDGAVQGKGCSGCMIEVFADQNDEGDRFIGATTSAEDGTFALPFVASQIPESFVTATNTDPNGNTSGFAEAIPIQSEPGSELSERLYLPLLDR